MVYYSSNNVNGCNWCILSIDTYWIYGSCKSANQYSTFSTISHTTHVLSLKCVNMLFIHNNQIIIQQADSQFAAAINYKMDSNI